jgi:hypothetical protein
LRQRQLLPATRLCEGGALAPSQCISRKITQALDRATSSRRFPNFGPPACPRGCAQAAPCVCPRPRPRDAIGNAPTLHTPAHFCGKYGESVGNHVRKRKG